MFFEVMPANGPAQQAAELDRAPNTRHSRTARPRLPGFMITCDTCATSSRTATLVPRAIVSKGNECIALPGADVNVSEDQIMKFRTYTDELDSNFATRFHRHEAVISVISRANSSTGDG